MKRGNAVPREEIGDFHGDPVIFSGDYNCHNAHAKLTSI